MNEKSLAQEKCIPCEKPVPPMTEKEVHDHLSQLSQWTKVGKQIEREFVFKDFVHAIAFVNKLAEVAENEQHHPDLFIHYNRVKVSFWTHMANGLTKNDFIMAAKINAIH